MKIILAPDSYKGSLTALRAAEIMEEAAQAAFPGCETVKIPVADGGEGTLDAIAEAAGGERRSEEALDPLGRPIRAEYALLDGGKTAVVEMAQASGITLVNPGDPWRASTFGTGQMIRKAVESGAEKVLVGIGGSATNDGGMGLLSALGMEFYDAQSNRLTGCGGDLEKVARVNADGLMHPKIEVICDVTNPLLGENGATRVYGPQKGAKGELLERLEAGMAHYADVMQVSGFAAPDFPGAGAAGGVGYALAGVLGAKLRAGIDAVLETVHFEDRLRGASLVITGEGRLDSQTVLYGKVPSGIARRCRAQGIPTIAVAGSLGAGAETYLEAGCTGLEAMVDRPMEIEEALAGAEDALYRATARALCLVKIGMKMR